MLGVWAGEGRCYTNRKIMIMLEAPTMLAFLMSVGVFVYIYLWHGMDGWDLLKQELIELYEMHVRASSPVWYEIE